MEFAKLGLPPLHILQGQIVIEAQPEKQGDGRGDKQEQE
jgi:hypothetical protein